MGSYSIKGYLSLPGTDKNPIKGHLGFLCILQSLQKGHLGSSCLIKGLIKGHLSSSCIVQIIGDIKKIKLGAIWALSELQKTLLALMPIMVN